MRTRDRRPDARATSTGVAPGRPSTPAAPPAAACSRSARSSSDASASGGSKSWRTTPKAKSRSSSVPRERRTRMPLRRSPGRAAASSAVLPIPAGPSTTTKCRVPLRASASADSIRASSPLRSSSGLEVPASLIRATAPSSNEVNVYCPTQARTTTERRVVVPPPDIRSCTGSRRAQKSGGSTVRITRPRLDGSRSSDPELERELDTSREATT